MQIKSDTGELEFSVPPANYEGRGCSGSCKLACRVSYEAGSAQPVVLLSARLSNENNFKMAEILGWGVKDNASPFTPNGLRLLADQLITAAQKMDEVLVLLRGI